MKRPWLAPLAPLYAAGAALRARVQTVQQLRWPVISVGNLSTGGTGKTPLTITLARALAARGYHVDVLSRGYGRLGSEAVRVDPTGTATGFGDEPLLIARTAGVPVYVASRRYDAGLLAEADFARQNDAPGQDRSGRHDAHEGQFSSAHILDDGFQHRQLARAVDVLLLNRADWQDALLPAGNLRDPLRAALRASVIAIPAEDTALASELRAFGWSGPVWRLHRRMQAPAVSGAVAAFCGIARPEQFFAGLESAGLRLAARAAFRDHHAYTAADVARIAAAARAAGATALITTEKDLVRLGPLAAQFPPDMPLRTAQLTTEIEDHATSMDWLVAKLNATPAP
ncbi:MAG TPA: tetraacyldisaccharide 4'-kinase [Terracidiphilus sp.]|jgi:tetraacyldisaccharide 4'-kinase|nr:tetraacyldisaccharide 4'-kinase [Terracidiphilus sp.]